MTKKMPIKEFREKGYLQELNRLFLHPLGLALELTINDDGSEFISGVWDYRERPEGIYFDIANSSQGRKETFINKMEFILGERGVRDIDRKRVLGFTVEPIITAPK